MDKYHFIPFGGTDNQAADIDHAEIVVLPLCYERGASYGTGSEKGPFYLLDASTQLDCLDGESLIDWSKIRIHTLQPLFPASDPQQAVKQMQQAAENVISHNKFLLSIGGDHAVSIGPIMAAANVHPDMGVLQIDAHLDLRDEWNGSKYNHACVMRRVSEALNLPIAAVGIRSFSPEEADYMKKQNIKPFYAHEVDTYDNSWVEKVVKALPEKVYLTIDLDGLDPSVIPATGTPEPDGLSYRQLVNLIKTVGQKRKVVAADINELAPIEGSPVSEFTAAKIASKIFVHCLPHGS
jgi:agmatinase